MSKNKFNPTYDNLRQAGFVPIPCIGKTCALRPSWKERDEFTDDEWKQASDVAVRTGKQKDGSYLSCIDVDTKDAEIFDLFAGVIMKHSDEPGFNYYLEESVHGFHAFFKTSEPVGSSRKMWRREGKEKDDIELKAGVAYVRIFPCAGFKVHEGALERLTPMDSGAFLSIVDSLTNIVDRQPKKPAVVPVKPTFSPEVKPTDYINANPALYLAYLQGEGWEVIGESDDRWNLKRPGSIGLNNIGATVAKKDGMTHVFTSKLNTPSNDTVSPVHFLANEYFNGSFADACRYIRENMMPSGCAGVPADFTVNFDQINERAKKIEERMTPKAHWSASIESAIVYGSAHKDEMKTKLPAELYNSSPRLREMVDFISDKDDGCRIGSFASAWTVAGMVCGRKVFEEHAQDNKLKHCSTAQYTFAFAPSGTGKSAGEDLIRMVCRAYDEPLFAVEKEREEGELEAYEAKRIEWEKEDKSTRGPAPKKPERAKRFRRVLCQPASVQAFFEDLKNRTDGKAVVLCDEGGDYVDVVCDPHAKEYLSGIRTTYKKAFTSERGEIVNETSLSQRGKSGTSEIRIENPSISLFYSGVAPASWDKYAGSVEDGTFGRFNWFFFDDNSEDAIQCTNRREERFDWRRTRIQSWAMDWATMDDWQQVEWTEGALAKLSGFLTEVRTEKRKWAKKNPLFAECVAHSPLRFAKAALLYAVIDKGKDEDMRFARIDGTACDKAYTFMMYQFAMLTNVFNLVGGMQESEIIRTLREYTKGICDDNGFFTVKALLTSGFAWRGWNKNTAVAKLKALNEEGVEWNGRGGKYAAFRLPPVED